MKNYHEMIQFTVDEVENNTLRYQEWAVAVILAEVYGVARITVIEDINFEKKYREKKRKDQRKTENRVAHEQRRQANLARTSAE